MVGHVVHMNRVPPTIEMLPDGSFRVPPRRPLAPFSAKVMLGALLVAAVALSVAMAVLAIWVVSLVLPVIIIAGAVAWAMYKFRRWQLLRSHQGGGFGVPRKPGGFGQ